MRFHGWVFIALGLLVNAARSDDSAAARAVVARAIHAHGGEAALAKWPAVSAKAEGIFQGHGSTPVFFFTSEMMTHGSSQTRHFLKGKLNGQTFLIANVLDGDRGWVKMAGNAKEETREFTPAELHDQREDAYVGWIGTLTPLKSRDFTLAMAGEEKVPTGPAVGVRVSAKGHRDVTLFFDKETGLLVKTETRARAGTGVEGKVETVYSRHKEFGGVQRPTTLTVYHNGRGLISYYILDYQLSEAPEAGAFRKP